MVIRKFYNKIKFALEKLPEKLELFKTVIAENRAINHKRAIYKTIHWSKNQQEQFDTYWKNNYGKTISNKWHKLYQACSGVFAIDYIPEKLYTTKIEPFLNDYSYARVLEDKAMVELLSNNCYCTVPATLVLCSNGQLYNNNREPISKEEAIKHLVNQCFIIKPTVNSSSGKGIIFMDSEDATEENIRSEITKQGDNFIVQKVIDQHPIFANLNNYSINTIRITTYLIENEIKHTPLALRMGRFESKVDNIHAGGLVVGVNDDGTLLPYAYELGYGNKTKKYDKHPDSHILFSGYKLPCIDNIIKSAHITHGHYPHIGIISWDYTVDRNGMPVLIEANIMGQSVWIVQMIFGKSVFEDKTSTILQMLKNY